MQISSSSTATTWSYRWGLFLGVLTFLGFIVEAVLDTQSAEYIGKSAFFIVCATPFVNHSMDVLADDIARKLQVGPKTGTVLFVVIFCFLIAARVLLLRFILIVSVLVAFSVSTAFISKVVNGLKL